MSWSIIDIWLTILAATVCLAIIVKAVEWLKYDSPWWAKYVVLMLFLTLVLSVIIWAVIH